VGVMHQLPFAVPYDLVLDTRLVMGVQACGPHTFPILGNLTLCSWHAQTSNDPLKVAVQHLKDETYNANDDVLKVTA